MTYYHSLLPLAAEVYIIWYHVRNFVFSLLTPYWIFQATALQNSQQEVAPKPKKRVAFADDVAKDSDEEKEDEEESEQDDEEEEKIVEEVEREDGDDTMTLM